MDDGVIHRSADAHRAQHRLYIVIRAYQLQTILINEEHIGALAHGDLSNVVATQEAGTASRRHLEDVVARGGGLAGVETVEEIGHPQLFQEAVAVVAGAAVHRQAHRHIQLQHLGDAGNARGQLHVGDGAVCHACLRSCQEPQFFLVKVDAVGIPHIAAHPAKTLHIGQGAAALTLQHEILLVLRLAQVGVQPHAVLTGEDGALPQQFRRHGEGGAGSQCHAAHTAVRGVMVLLDSRHGVSHNFIHRLHHAVGRQTAILYAQIHTAAAHVEAHAQRIRCAFLRTQEVAAAVGEHVVMVKNGGAAVLH